VNIVIENLIKKKLINIDKYANKISTKRDQYSIHQHKDKFGNINIHKIIFKICLLKIKIKLSLLRT